MIRFLRRKIPSKKVEAHIAGIPVLITFKRVKTLRVTIRPPHADVLVSAPLGLGMASVERFVADRKEWIEHHRKDILSRPRVLPPTFSSGEKLFVWGEEVELRVEYTQGRPSVKLIGKELVLHVGADSDGTQRAQVIDRWLKKEVRGAVPAYLSKWEARMGVQSSGFSVRKMKTRWGSCTPTSRTIRFNSELGRKSPECLEYVVVHELAHLIERSHNARFKAILDGHMPDWREIEGLLNPKLSKHRGL